jgi:hypothetical protein
MASTNSESIVGGNATSSQSEKPLSSTVALSTVNALGDPLNQVILIHENAR